MEERKKKRKKGAQGLTVRPLGSSSPCSCPLLLTAYHELGVRAVHSLVVSIVSRRLVL